MSASTPAPPRSPRTPSPSKNDRRSHARDQSLSIQDSPAPSIHEDYDYDIKQGLTDSPIRSSGTTTTTTAYNMSRAAGQNLLSPASAGLGLYAGGAAHPQSTLHPLNTSSSAIIDGDTDNSDGDGGSSADGSADGSADAAVPQPFNFVTQQYVSGKSSIGRRENEALGKRKGHKYRHSSIHASHMDAIFKPLAPQRTPLAIPASLPMPTRREAWRSMTRDQTRRAGWCACHFLIAGGVQFLGGEESSSLLLTTLSRLLLFDAAAASVCVGVDIMGNFEVWARSSIRHPFGLARADVLAGFGLAVFIAFMGLDVISHGVQHALENLGTHEAHNTHKHDGRVSVAGAAITSVLAIASTLVSALLLKNHGRIGKAMRFEMAMPTGAIAAGGWGPKIFGNPSHCLTTTCSLLLLLLPHVSGAFYNVYDRTGAFCMAALMIALGVRLATSLASMLLMSFRTPTTNEPQAVQNVIREIAQACDPAVVGVDDARFWQVHYGLCMANLRLKYREEGGKLSYGGGSGGDETVGRIRQRVSDLIRRRFGGLKWEVSIQLVLDTN